MNTNDVNFTGRTIDPMDISCRSDLTHDLEVSYNSRRPNTRDSRNDSNESSRGETMPKPMLSRGVTESSHNSFHTANNMRADIHPLFQFGENDENIAMSDAVEDDEEDSMMAELDEQAERAAIACFGEEADAPLVEAPLRRSALVSENSTIDGKFKCVDTLYDIFSILNHTTTLTHKSLFFLHWHSIMVCSPWSHEQKIL